MSDVVMPPPAPFTLTTGLLESALLAITSFTNDFTTDPFCVPSYFKNLLLNVVISACVIPLLFTVSCAWLNIIIPNDINSIANNIAPAIINAFDAFSIKIPPLFFLIYFYTSFFPSNINN